MWMKLSKQIAKFVLQPERQTTEQIMAAVQAWYIKNKCKYITSVNDWFKIFERKLIWMKSDSFEKQ